MMEWKVTLMGILGLFGLYLIGTVVIKPLKFIVRIILYVFIGILLLFLANFVLGQFGLHIAVNPFTILMAGLFQLPGVIFMVLAQFLL